MARKNGSLKDILYDSMDYIMILVIVLVVGGLIYWRLDLLFNESNMAKLTSDVKLEEDLDIKPLPAEELKKEVEEKKLEEPKETNSLENKDIGLKETSKNKDDKSDSNDLIKVNIPNGSDSSAIASILEDRGLVKNSQEFLDKCEELNKSTKLKAGDFSIPKNSTTEEIIGYITK